MNVVERIEKWAEDRNIIKGSDAKTQALKLVSEMGELATHLHADCMDDIGDCMVVLIVISKQQDCDMGNIMEQLHTFDVSQFPISHENYIFLELARRVGKLSDNLIKGKDVITDISDVIAILYMLSCRKNYCFTECLEHAYNDIKDRTGISCIKVHSSNQLMSVMSLR